MKRYLDKIKEKAESQKLKTRLYKRKPDFIYEEDEDDKEVNSLIIQVPEGRDFKSIVFDENDDELKEVVKSDFEKFKFLKSFEAVWSNELGVIECEIQTDEMVRSPRFILGRISRLFNPDGKSPKSKRIFEFPSPDPKIKIFLGESSQEFSILTSFQEGHLFRSMRSRPSIRIEYDNLKTHDEANELLKKIANSVLFQLDLAINLPLHLSLDRELFREIRISRRKARRGEIKLTKPKFEYDEEPMALYWYGRTASNMPLLQYLAFYQVIEFYFPHYSYREAQQKIKNLLKDPLFDSDKDGDVSKILGIIKTSSKGKSFGDERSQIKATINHCITDSELREFICGDEGRQDFFDVQKKAKSAVKQKVSLANENHDIRPEVANRIYDIRCRIVHTKEEADKELLLPFSPEVKNLKHDLDLIEFITRKVLIAGGRTLKI
jgi:hypothetical protein